MVVRMPPLVLVLGLLCLTETAWAQTVSGQDSTTVIAPPKADSLGHVLSGKVQQGVAQSATVGDSLVIQVDSLHTTSIAKLKERNHVDAAAMRARTKGRLEFGGIYGQVPFASESTGPWNAFAKGNVSVNMLGIPVGVLFDVGTDVPVRGQRNTLRFSFDAPRALETEQWNDAHQLHRLTGRLFGYAGALNPLAESFAYRAISNPAHSVGDAVRLNNQLLFEEAASIFTSTGELTPQILNRAQIVIANPGNPLLPPGLAKYITPTTPSPAGPFQVHFYMDPSTKIPYYGRDYKIVFKTILGTP